MERIWKKSAWIIRGVIQAFGWRGSVRIPDVLNEIRT
jgi:hypothetical protein